MNRKIKFRGKTKVDFGNGNKEILIPKGTWIYGGIVFDDSERVWIDMKYYGQILVDENTIGQYTGLHDKNGKEIYESDILEVSYQRASGVGYVEYDNNYCEYKIIINANKDYFSLWKDINLKKVGNIYDNPELLGGKNGI